MPVCSKCGHLNRYTARYCTGCGASLAETLAPYTPLVPGKVMKGGTYVIQRRLGKGGMGAVYLAAQAIASQQRYVVIKELLDYVNPDDYTTNTEYQQARVRAQQRFEDEAGMLVRLSHVGIPRIDAFFSEAERNYIVMEHIEGSDLLQGLSHADEQRGQVLGSPYPLQDVLSLSVALCRVLEYLARQSSPVIHHDIKPANIILDANSGTARLVDFGTAQARLLHQPGGRVGVQKSSVYGTDGYAAPEMYSQTSSPLSDVYSLAATIYHLLTDDDPRDHPFRFPQLEQLPDAVANMLRRALNTDAAQRPSATQLRIQIEQLQTNAISLSAPSVSSPGSRQFQLLVGRIYEIEYVNAQGVCSRRRIAPLRHRGALVDAWCYTSGVELTFRVDRIQGCSLAGEVPQEQLRSWLGGTASTGVNQPTAASSLPTPSKAPSVPVVTYAGPPRMIVDPESLDIKTDPDTPVRLSLLIANRGYSLLRGTVKVKVPWLQVTPRRPLKNPLVWVVCTLKTEPYPFRQPLNGMKRAIWGNTGIFFVHLLTRSGARTGQKGPMFRPKPR